MQKSGYYLLIVSLSAVISGMESFDSHWLLILLTSRSFLLLLLVENCEEK